jgi:predicted choloylglycine hydrolase
MAVFNSVEEFIASTKSQIEASVKSVLPKLKERAQEIVLELIYSKYTPHVYERINQLISAFEIKCEWNGDECVGILYVKSDVHNPSNWIGENYPLDEIIVDYFSRDHVYKNGIEREGVDVMGTIESRHVAEALQLLLGELKKYFDIV